jgi:predicted nucleic-acid-binding protein
MIGLDTNVLTRHFAKDDPLQAAQATALLNSLSNDDQGFVSVVTLIELVWVLQSQYRLGKPEIITIVEALLQSPELKVQDSDVVSIALSSFFGSKCEFADCLIAQIGISAGCTTTMTFDKQAAKQLGMQLVRPIP